MNLNILREQKISIINSESGETDLDFSNFFIDEKLPIDSDIILRKAYLYTREGWPDIIQN